MPDQAAFNFLVVIETQKTKNYLFASPAMREIRGGSLLLDRINRIEIAAILERYFSHGDYEVIYLGGGSGRVLFREENAGRVFCSRVEAFCRKETVNGRIVGELVAQLPGEPFSEWQARGLDRTNSRKTGRSEPMAQVAGRWIRPCTSCGSLPAEKMFEEHGVHYLCTACLLKRLEVNNLYREIKPRESGLNPLKPAAELESIYSKAFIYTTLAEACENMSGGCALLMPQDFNNIGDASRPGNYMAFIYADGNRMGETMRRMGRLYPATEEALWAQKAFSEIVDRACREAAVEAVLKHVLIEKPISGDPDYGFIPAEFIMAGGDDLMLAVPAQNALEVAADFLDLYQEKTRTLQHASMAAGKLPRPFAPCGLTSSAGVVVAHAAFPVRYLMDHAADLMKVAKESAARQPEENERGTLDFMVVNDAGSSGVKDRRKEEYKVVPNYSLTARPCTSDQARRLVETIRELKRDDVPRTKLKKIYATLFQSPMQAQYDGLRLRQRLHTTGALAPGRPLAVLFESLPYFPFQARPADPGKEEWNTPLSEIVEFFDYIQLQ